MFRHMYGSRLSTIKICTVLAALPLMLSGCGSKEATLIPESSRTNPAVLEADEQEITLQDSSLLYGNLRLELRDGIEAEVLSAEEYGNFFAEWEDGTVVALPGADELYKRQGEFAPDDLPLPARIRFMHYLAEYENETELISTLFSLIPDAVGERIYADEEKCEYAYRMRQDEAQYERQYFIFVQEKDVYLIQEIQGTGMHWGGHFTVGSLLSDNALSWEDSGAVICPSPDADGLRYRRITPEEDYVFLCEYYKEDSLRLYRDGCFDEPYQIIGQDNGEKFSFRSEDDINFDGCPDMVGDNKQHYLWDKENKKYCAAQTEVGLYYLYNRRFPETQTIWEHTMEYTQDWATASETEALWQWEDTRLVKKRECVEKTEADGIRLYAYGESPEDILFDETFSTAEWEQEEQGRVRLLYEQFYDGMLPKEVYSEKHTLESEPQYIPQELLDELADAVLLGIETEAETVSEMCSGREVSREDMLLFAESSRDIFIQMVSDPYYTGCWVTVKEDCDNDGIQDIIAQVDRGGTAAIRYYIFFKGQPDGTYVRTSEFSAFEEGFAVISYQGKNYLCRMPFDIDRRIDYGFTLIAYEDGKRVEEVSLTLVPEDYDVRIIYDVEENTAKDVSEDISSDYSLLADDIAKNCLTTEAQLAKFETVIGSAEQVIDMTDDKGNFCCDLDNDGEDEFYEKHIWKTHHRLSSQLIFTCEDETDEDILLLQEKIEEEGRPLMMWVEPSEESFTEPFTGENIINVFYRTGQEDFKIVGFLLEENDCRKVYEVAADARYEVKKSCQALFGN